MRDTALTGCCWEELEQDGHDSNILIYIYIYIYIFVATKEITTKQYNHNSHIIYCNTEWRECSSG